MKDRLAYLACSLASSVQTRPFKRSIWTLLASEQAKWREPKRVGSAASKQRRHPLEENIGELPLGTRGEVFGPPVGIKQHRFHLVAAHRPGRVVHDQVESLPPHLLPGPIQVPGGGLEAEPHRPLIGALGLARRRDDVRGGLELECQPPVPIELAPPL